MAFVEWCSINAGSVRQLTYIHHERGARGEGYFEASHVVAGAADGRPLRCGTLEWRPQERTMSDILGFRDQLLGLVRERWA